jgi:type IV pilus assembly protein PilW
MTIMDSYSSYAAAQRGFSLIELMISMVISMLIAGALAIVFMKVGETNREQFKASQQIENGRFAVDLMGNDIRHAGYYGEFGGAPSAGGFGALPDPCDVSLLTVGDITTATTTSPLAFHVQGYNAATLTTALAIPTACQTWIDGASLKAGSDILVIRRVDTLPLIDLEASPVRSSATPTSGALFAQTTTDIMSVQSGSGTAIDKDKTAAGAASALLRKDYSKCWNDTTWVACPTTPTTTPTSTRPVIAANIRKLRVHVYYVSNCRKGSGANGKCAAGDDTIPTLKRLELTAAGGAPTMTVVPLVEGIEFMKVRYGNDSSLDGTADNYTATPALADWPNIVQVETRVVARNVDSSTSTDPKSYDLGGGLTYTPSGAAAYYKRHLFAQQTYITNVGGRRER